jgi:DNA helicase HerA-like ATPase
MDQISEFQNQLKNSYTHEGSSIVLGGAMLNKSTLKGSNISVPLKTFNRHGLIAGATGTGKTKTLQKICELLVQNGVSVLAMDIKGDLSGISQAGEDNEGNIAERMNSLGITWAPQSTPTEFLSISTDTGVKLRATVTEFGPVLFSKLLDLNDVQSGVVALIFKYADDNQLPLIDLEDFKKIMLFVTNEAKDQVKSEYGQVSTATVGTIQRKILEIESQGAGEFFGEPSFDVFDLLNGKVNLLKLDTIQDKPMLFSTFMLSLLAEVYQKFPEAGDLDKPKLVIFIDEAHLIFNNASEQLLRQIETVIKLIRSKGIGIFFITQQPTDIPANVLSQLGMKVQHALRAFTAKDRKSIKLVSENYPESIYYDTENLLTELGIGEALFTCLNEKGIPTPLVHLKVSAPESRMSPATEIERQYIIGASQLVRKYSENIDRESAKEILLEKIQKIQEAKLAEESILKEKKENKDDKNLLEDLAQAFMKNATSSAARSIGTKIIRGIFGKL